MSSKTPYEIFYSDLSYVVSLNFTADNQLANNTYIKGKWNDCKESFEVLKSYKNFIRKTGQSPSVQAIFDLYYKKASEEKIDHKNIMDVWIKIRELASQFVDYQNIFLLNKMYNRENKEYFEKLDTMELDNLDFDNEINAFYN